MVNGTGLNEKVNSELKTMHPLLLYRGVHRYIIGCVTPNRMTISQSTVSEERKAR